MSAAKTLPWTRACFVCGQENPHGLRLRCRLEDGRAVLLHTAREADLGWKTFVHGGILMALLDEAMAWAAMARLRRNGGRTIAESEESAVVYGMPAEVVAKGGASKVLAVEKVASQLAIWTSQ